MSTLDMALLVGGLERMLAAAGDAEHAPVRLISRLCVALDEFISDSAQGDPARAAEALAELGMTKTSALFGAEPA